MRTGTLAVFLAGCAIAGRDRPAAEGVDAHPASHDAPTGCTTRSTDLLMNGAFDTMPAGSGWVSTPANPTYPIVTSNGTVAAQSAPDKAWMGSFVSKTDDMHEDVAIPASTTALVLAGYYQVRTTETATTANDTAKVELADSSGSLLESALALDNTQATTAWVPFTYSITSNVAGKPIRLVFTTANNSTKATSFYFDTVTLTATSCQ